jgi:hypothetical protein
MAKTATATTEPQNAAESSASQSQPSRTSSSPPEVTFRVGRVTASVFINQTNSNGDGEQRTRRFRSVAVQRSYKDQNDKTKFVSSFGLGEIRNAIRVLELAAQHMEEKESVFTQ